MKIMKSMKMILTLEINRTLGLLREQLGVSPVWALTLQAQACIFTGGTPVLPVLHWPPYRLFISKIRYEMFMNKTDGG